MRDEYERISHEIQSWYDDAPAEQSYIAEGNCYNCNVSARENVNQVKDLAAVLKYFKRDRFLELADIALGVLRKALPDDLHSQFILTTQTGKRRLEPVTKAMPIDRSKRAA